MSDKKEKPTPAIDPQIAALEGQINMLKGMMETVEKKARIDSNVNNALFHVVKRYRLYRRDGKWATKD